MLAACASRCRPRLSLPVTARAFHVSRTARAEADTKPKDVFSETLKQVETRAKPKKLWAQGRFSNLSTSTKKLNPVCALIRGLSYNEAVAQLTFNTKKNATVVRRCLDTVRYSAENNYGLNADRLVVAEASVGRQSVRKKPYFHARGRTGVETTPSSFLRIVLREMPVVIGEIRLGRWGTESKFKGATAQ